MRCSPRPDDRAPGWRAPLLLAGSLALVAPGAPATTAAPPAPGIHVRAAELRDVDGTYFLDAHLDFDFSEETIEAMRNGVAVTVLVDVEVLRQRALWDLRVARRQARYRIERHALSEHYVVRDVITSETTSYRSFDVMVEGLGEISDVPVLERAVLEPDGRYVARMRSLIDIESLPSPLRPLAYLSSVWRLRSEWFTWPIDP